MHKKDVIYHTMMHVATCHIYTLTLFAQGHRIIQINLSDFGTFIAHAHIEVTTHTKFHFYNYTYFPTYSQKYLVYNYIKVNRM